MGVARKGQAVGEGGQGTRAGPCALAIACQTLSDGAKGQVDDWHRARWEIELFFLVLKESCPVERLLVARFDPLSQDTIATIEGASIMQLEVWTDRFLAAKN